MSESEGLRASVAESWQVSAAAGVRPEDAEAPITLSTESVRDLRRAHPLAQVFPLLDDVLGAAARECDAVMAVSDASAQLLWVCGNPTALRSAEAIGFVEGSNWDERLAGTNAPGMALRLGGAARVIGAEHFRSSVKAWSCAASPIHDPLTGELLGVLDITGGDVIAAPQTMAMIRATVRMAETELAHRRPVDDAPAPSGTRLSLQALGRSEALLTVHHGQDTHTVRLSPRHSEIMVLLAAAPRGLSGDELGYLLYEHDTSASTLRAEMNRLRGLLDHLVASRPYRIVEDVRTDWLGVEGLVASGDLVGALRLFRGPLLPRSTAPGIERLREGVTQGVRRAVLGSRSPDLMSTWTRSSWGSDDYDMWVAQRDLIGPGSPLLPLIGGQIDRLDRELA
ncbi:MAG: transcriptional regulator [Myxococcales bacterium]|nr:MAG: transcriptional regulator [Myxococcales bacterium]